MRPNDEVQNVPKEAPKDDETVSLSREELQKRLMEKMPEEFVGTPEWKRKVQIQAINNGK